MTTRATPDETSPSCEPSSKEERSAARARHSDPSVREIIASARSAAPPARGVWLLSGLTALLMWASFTPLDWGPLGWLCLIPLIALVRPSRRPRLFYTTLYGAGLLFWLPTLQWMRLGDPSMYAAWFALAIYLAVYFPMFVGVCRVAVHRFGAPLIVAVPIVFVGLEYARATVITGFAWYNLGHTLYRWVELIQISDLVGAYGVSFVIALTSACFASLLPRSLFVRLSLVPANSTDPKHASDSRAETSLASCGGFRRQACQVGICLAVFGLVLGYGYVRRSQAEFRNGPRLALIQGNFTTSLKHDRSQWPTIYQYHHALTGEAVKHQPDVIVWPETMFRWPLFDASPDLSEDELQKLAPRVDPQAWSDTTVKRTLQDMSGMAGAAFIIGIEAILARRDGLRHYNSAVLARPDVGLHGRYDKQHRVLFGEYIPLKNELPWLHKLTPFSSDWGIDAGQSAVVFNYKNWRLAPIICFEDTVPHLVRGIVYASRKSGNSANSGQDARRTNSAGKTVDCLINLTNDGWFHGSSGLDQHLITALFRCVECRTPMARAVNTGISAIIDGDGIVVDPEVFIDGDADGPGQGRTSMRDPKTGRWHKQLNAALVHTVPLDDRTSLYVAYGDWFAGSCLALTIFVFLGVFLPHRSSPSGGRVARSEGREERAD